MKSYLPRRFTEPFKRAWTLGSLLVAMGSVAQAQTIISYTGEPLTVNTWTDSVVFSFTTGQAMTGSIGPVTPVETPQFRLGYIPLGSPDQPTLSGFSPAPGEFYGSVLNLDDYVVKLNAGDSIGSTSGVYTGEWAAYLWKPIGLSEGAWAPGTTGYAGLQFHDPVTDQVNYGWALITYGDDKSLTLVSFAYDTTGAAILAGAIPEPSSWALILGGGVLAAAACRKRRRASSPVARPLSFC